MLSTDTEPHSQEEKERQEKEQKGEKDREKLRKYIYADDTVLHAHSN